MRRSAICGLIVGLNGFATVASAATVPVSTADELVGAIAKAAAGDEIVLADGDYALVDVSCSAAGEETKPIVVRAASPGGAHIAFSGTEGFKVSGAYWTFEDLVVEGSCANDAACEHAFHVTGAADGFVLRGSRVVDFNAQIKVNATPVGGTYRAPRGGLVEYDEFGDTHARATDTPVTKVNIDAGDAWIVRANFIHDFVRTDGAPTYGAFMKSGGKGGVFERNLVLCRKDLQGSESPQIGLSFGGGGTGAQYCAPAYDPNVPCDVEHEGGTMKNNIVAACSDVGVYLNRAKDTHLFHNTLVDTTGIDFRFATSSGEAVGNVLGGRIRTRDGAQAPSLAVNLEEVSSETFAQMYVEPRVGDLRPKGDLSALLGKNASPPSGVTDDYCARARATPFDLGALQHSLGACDTRTPPRARGDGDGGTPENPSAPDGGSDDPSNGAGNPAADGSSDGASDGGCRSAPSSRAPWTALIGLATAAVAITLRRRR